MEHRTLILTHRKNKNGINTNFNYIDLKDNRVCNSPITSIVAFINEYKWSYMIKNSDETLTEVEVVDGTFLRCLSNDGKIDNINSLPTY